MIETPNEKKNRLLGQPYGTATSKLRKMLLFELVKMIGADTCYRCHTRIEKIEEFSIEHTIPWQGAENPKEAFFDLNHISYSHLRCNVAEGNKGKRIYIDKSEKYKAAHVRIKGDPIRYEKKLSDKRKH